MAREEIVELLHGHFARRKFFQDLRDALGFVANDKGLLQLLKVNRRAIFGGNVAEFVARQNVEQQVAFFEPVNPFLEKIGREFPRRQ